MSSDEAVAREVREVTAQLARELEHQQQSLTTELAALFLDEIPAFRGDEAVRELMTASTASNVSTIADVLAHGLPLERLDVPAAAAAYARRFAQRDLPVEGLLRAYRLGQARLTRWFLAELGRRRLSSEVLLGCTQEVLSVVGRYIDQISEHLVYIYEAERKLWSQRTDAARAIALRTVLADDTLTAGTAEAMIGYRLSGWHLAAVAWVAPDTPNAARLVESAAHLLGQLHGERPLAVLNDDHALWAWLSGPAPVHVDERELAERLSPPVHLALGETGEGMVGFRASHREARQARAVAETSGAGAPALIRFTEVSIAALLSEDLPALRTWVGRTLGELARDDEGTARLRETVRVFLETGGSFTDAATRLHLHKNTVHYRVRKAEEVRGRPFSDRRLDVEVALTACHHLGQPVLLP